jgi:segregation and condensation protein B
MSSLERIVESLLFLSPEPVSTPELAEACDVTEAEIDRAIDLLGASLAERGVVLRQVAGGHTLAAHPDAGDAARRLLARPKTPPLTQAQAETLAIIAYLQPVSRPEITRIRGVSADSAAGTLLERGLIEESGRSPFGAVLYRTTSLFLKLFGMASLDDLPDVEEWDPSPEEEADLRERLLRAGEARAGAAPTTQELGDDGEAGAPAAAGEVAGAPADEAPQAPPADDDDDAV